MAPAVELGVARRLSQNRHDNLFDSSADNGKAAGEVDSVLSQLWEFGEQRL